MKWATPLLLSSRRHADCSYARKHNSIWVRRSFSRFHPDLNFFSPLFFNNLLAIPRFLILIHFNKLDGCRVLSCFPFRRRAKSVCCLRFIKLPLKNPFSTEFWWKLAADYNSQVFQSFEMKRRASSAQKQHRDSFLRNKLPPKTQNAGGESTGASAPKVLQLLFWNLGWNGNQLRSSAQSNFGCLQNLAPQLCNKLGKEMSNSCWRK